VLIRRGRSALSLARLARALAKGRVACPGLRGLQARWVHLVTTERPLTAAEAAQLDAMLAYGPLDEVLAVSPLGSVETMTFFVTPRLGTTSPWSSKATDIAHVCGLAAITRIERSVAYVATGAGLSVRALGAVLADRMTESVIVREADLVKVVAPGGAPRPLGFVALGADPIATLTETSARLGLALAGDEIAYLVERYRELGRDPTDVELMMFAQANSEHCRHKIFNAEYHVAGELQPDSLFQLIKRSTQHAPEGVLSAYKDNAAVVEGVMADRLFADADGVYRGHHEPQHILGKVETHNHPTAISPFPGAATGSGGEIRDEGATGRGGKPKAGLVGFTVSDLRLPGALEPWEPPAARWIGSPARIATALEIMTDGPLGGAAFNNEFGRPAILGYFRTFELPAPDPDEPAESGRREAQPEAVHSIVGGSEAQPEAIVGGRRQAQPEAGAITARGYHKPVMLAGGIGAVRPGHVAKAPIPAGAALIVLGGPAFLIGLGGGAASSLAQGASAEALDFASVQRDNPEIQRRCQEVIDRCWAMGADNPILSIHDVGAGGLSNALPELVHDAGLGARLALRAIPTGDPELSPLELWCNEAQERYVLAIAPERIDELAALCARERAPWARLGTATADGRLVVSDEGSDEGDAELTQTEARDQDPAQRPREADAGDPDPARRPREADAGDPDPARRPREADAADQDPARRPREADAGDPGPRDATRGGVNGPAPKEMRGAGIPYEGSESRDATRGGVNGPAPKEMRGAEIPYEGSESRDATRGGVNGPAQPVQRGRERPLSVINLPLEVMFGKPPRMVRRAEPVAPRRAALDLGGASVAKALDRVLGLPAVADKTFLVAIGDRTVGGLIARDPMIGRFQVPVADCALTLAGFDTTAGEVMAIGERPPIALLDAAAASRMAIGEAITNLAAAPIGPLSRIKLSCNWMAAADHPGEDARLYAAVRAASECAVALGVAIPVGKDSMSMRTVWGDDAARRTVVSPITLVVTAFGPVNDVRLAVTPELRGEGRALLLVDLGGGHHRLGGSCLAQVFGQLGDAPPDLDDPHRLGRCYGVLQALVAERALTAYHDRSDGGLVVTALEMAFAAGLGLELDVTEVAPDPFAALFSEELGAIVEVDAGHLDHVRTRLAAAGALVHPIGRAIAGDRIRIAHGGAVVVDAARSALRARWSHVTHQMAARRDDPACAAEEHAARLAPDAIGLVPQLTFDPAIRPAGASSAPSIVTGARPRVAILREQGVNGHIEMAAAFTRAGFEAIDVHMTDLVAGRADLADCRGVVACGGFSFGDVFGAGRGWAATFRYNARARDALARFTARGDTFALGVCNGCQALAELADQLPGATGWPRFVRNRSEQFESRLALVRIEPGPSIFFRDMAGSRIPVATAHGEGRAELDEPQLARLADAGLIAARFVDGHGAIATSYPANPNGSPGGLAALTSADGRITIMMPHPERVFRTAQMSWHPPEWGEDSPWMRMFYNARAWVR
jgi:phosphoribosylformylglycinamidine synthase